MVKNPIPTGSMSESRFYDGPAGRLDARLHGPAEGPPVLILHPHPLFSGSMGSRLVYDLAVGLGAAGYRAVRFDFRGVGRSKGAYGGGLGEVADAAMVLGALAKETGQTPALVGYSFGGAVACRVAGLAPVARLVMIGSPLEVRDTDLEPLASAAAVPCPVHLVVGERDPHVSVAQTRQLAEAFPQRAGVSVVAGAAHFLEPAFNPQAVAAVLAALSP